MRADGDEKAEEVVVPDGIAVTKFLVEQLRNAFRNLILRWKCTIQEGSTRNFISLTFEITVPIATIGVEEEIVVPIQDFSSFITDLLTTSEQFDAIEAGDVEDLLCDDLGRITNRCRDGVFDSTVLWCVKSGVRKLGFGTID